jgi:3',5'-cyclic AMP phosphodiesterase CpdA
MNHRRLAHLSDLHIGTSTDRAEALVKRLIADDIEHVVVTGDLTHEGAHAEFALFLDVFAPLFRNGRLTFIPGNHDRTGEDSGSDWMNGQRVRTEHHDGIFLVCVDSTGPHNRSYFASHGDLCPTVLEQIDEAISRAPANKVVAVLLHHHLVPLPEESMPEWIATRLGFPNACELKLGVDLLARLRGRCDLVLHGHRHTPREFEFSTSSDRMLGMYNAGSSTELGAFRIFEHGDGRLTKKPSWRVATTKQSKKAFSSNVIPAFRDAMRQLGDLRQQTWL